MRFSTGVAEYETIRILGKGNYGSVHVATVTSVKGDTECLVKGQQVVVKLQHTDSRETKRELAVMQHLNVKVEETSQFTPVLLDLAQNDEWTAIVMDYVENATDLFEVIMELSKLPRCDATRKIRIELMWQMLLCVHLLNEHGVYHRDIKPENFVTEELEHFTDKDMIGAWKEVSPLRQVPDMTNMTNLQRYVALRICSTDIDTNQELAFVSHYVSGPLFVKIIDFGLSTMLHDGFPSDGDVTFFGTPAYLDPWYAACHENLFKTYPAKSLHELYRCIDAWSLGMAIYAMFHGFVPFKDSTLRDTKHALSHLDGMGAGISSYELAANLCNWKQARTLFTGLFALIGGEDAINNPVRTNIRVSDRSTPSVKTMAVKERHIQQDIENGVFNERKVKSFERHSTILEDTQTINIVKDLLQIYPPDRDLDFLGMIERLQAL
jgi:serine/threonine protein kinase